MPTDEVLHGWVFPVLASAGAVLQDDLSINWWGRSAAFLAFVAGGVLLLYGWRARRGVIVVLGILGGGLGLLGLRRALLMPEISVPPLPLFVLGAVAGAFLLSTLERGIGFALGSLGGAFLVLPVLLSRTLTPGIGAYMAAVGTLLAGGVFGYLFFRFTLTTFTSAWGAALVTFGLKNLFFVRFAPLPRDPVFLQATLAATFALLLALGFVAQYRAWKIENVPALAR